MKTIHYITAILFSGLAISFAADPPTTAPKASAGAPSEKTSFQEVTSHLDPGGNLYLYLGIEQWVKNLSDKISSLRGIFSAMPNIKDEDREKLEKAFDVVTSIIKHSGIEDVSGVGMSSLMTEPGMYRSKFLLHHYKGQGSGFLWTMFGQKPHALNGLNLLSTNVAAAAFGDLDIAQLWSVIQKEVAAAGIPEAQSAMNKLPDAFERGTGLNWDKVLSSLGGEFGLVLSLDSDKKVTLPLPGAKLEIPEPGLMLVIKTTNDLIFNRLDQLLQKSGQQVTSVDKPNLKMRTVSVPLPLPIQLSPTLATSDGYLFIATNDRLIRDALAVKSGEIPGLKSTEEYKRLAKDIPQEGNQFSFMGRRFGETIREVQQQVLAANVGDSAPQQKLFQSLFSSGEPSFAYNVGGNTEEGWLAVANGNQHSGKLLLAAGALPAGLIAAIAIPNFVKARNTAQQNACINNLRQIDGAKQQWALENKKPETATPEKSDILMYFNSGKFPVCPAGGTYTINSVDTKPVCSVPNHEMP
jgi:hypothetical protein